MRLESDYKKSLRKGTIDMLNRVIFDMLKALIEARIGYWEKKQGDKTFHEDIIEELKLLKTIVGSAFKGE